jgi:nitroreductase
VTISWQGFAQAPVIIIVAVDISTDPRHYTEDGAAAATNMTLVAHSLGLASFWAGVCAEYDGRGSPEDDIRALLSIPRKLRIISALPIGVAASQPEATRRPLSEMIHWDGYTNGKAKAERGPRSA